MADNNNNRSIFDNIETIASAAGVVGIAASVLRGKNILSSGLNRATGAFSKSLEKLSMAGRNINYSTLRGAFSTFQDSYRNYDDSISFAGLKDGMAELYSELLNTRSRARSLAHDTVIKNATIGLQKRFSSSVSQELAEQRNIAINSFIRRGVRDLYPETLESYRNIQKLSDKTIGVSGLSFSDDDIKFMNDELKNLVNLFHDDEYGVYTGSIDEVKNLFSNSSEGFMSDIISGIQKDLEDRLLNIDDAERRFGSSTSPTKAQSFINSTLGDNPATLGDVVSYFKDHSKDYSEAQQKQINDFTSRFEKLISDSENGSRWSNLYFSNDIRIDSENNLHKFDALEDAVTQATNFFNETIVGKVLKTKELFGNKQRLLSYSSSGTVNPFIEKAVNGADSVLSNNAYVSIYGKMYKLADDKLEYIEGLDNMFEVAERSGIAYDSIKRMYGTDYQMYNSRTFLDFNESYKMNPWESAKAFISKFNDPRYGRNIADSVLRDNSDAISNISDIDSAFDLFGKYSDFVSILNKSNNTLDRTTAKKLSGIFNARNDDSSKDLGSLFNILSMNDNDMIEALSAYDIDKLADNSDLRKQISFLRKNPRDYLSRYQTESDYISGGNGVTKFSAFDIIRRSATEEAMHRMNSNFTEDTALQILSSFGGKESDNALKSYYSSVVSDIYKQSISYKAIEDFGENELTSQAIAASDSLNKYLGNNASAQKTLREMVNDNISLLQTGFNDKEYYTSQYSDRVFVKKSISPLDIIRNLNDSEKAKDTTKGFAKQFFAGVNNTGDVTSSTFGPFFYLNRLTKSFDRLGLGFDNSAYSSTLNLAGNLMFRRVLPVAGAIFGLSYLNFEMDKITGQSMSESLVSGIANIDLGFRRIADASGLTNQLKAASVYNPMFSYLLNEEEYQSYDERKQWYESGYSPVRSGRFWSFGSASEFRGGKISYWEPSYVRRTFSNYYDVSVYGSSEEKWKHSWIPTPRYPLSTLNALLNPYWVEEMHYEDRPYPVTGKMFDDGTPWGVVLNPTVGELLKPQRRMHQYELQGTTVDVRALIRKYNEQEKAKSQNSYISIGARDGVSMVAPIPGAYPIGEDGSVQPDYNVYYNDSDTAYYTGDPSQNQYITNNIGGYKVKGLNAADRIRVSSGTNPIAFAASQILPLDIISQINEDTKTRGEYNVRGGYYAGNFSATHEPIYSDSRQYDPTAENFDRSAFMDTRSIEEWLTDASYSAKELGGIYGFAFDLVFPPKQKYADAHAGAMTSFSGRFWDEAIGGFGGDVMEIARRFFPHEDHSVTRINNLRNTMPEWIPERFLYGDPYASLPKGDMRFPGVGYETLNELHPDIYGSYGSFDRMKILADIAPWSQEYKQWKEIARETVTDPALQEEMDEIERRAERQSAKHTFYNRNYDIDTQKISGVVESVSNKTFKLVGSDQTYRLAGIDLENQKLSDFLSAGSDIQLIVDKSDYGKNQMSAIAFVNGSHNNISKELLNNGVGEYTRDTPLDVQTHTNGFSLGQYITEQIAHAPIPYIHNKFMRVNTPLESWDEEELYGTSYSTWNHPIEGFIFPAFRKTMAMDNVAVAVNIAAFGLSKYLDSNNVSDIINYTVDDISLKFDVSDLNKYFEAGNGTNKVFRIGAKTAQALTNPLSFAGGMTASLLTGNTKYTAIGADIGEAIGLAAIAYQNMDNPFISTISGAILGGTYGARFFGASSKYGALVGGAIGLGLSALKNPDFDLDHLTSDTYIPESAEERWELQEYFDRLRYIKYTGLYEKAAREAKEKEGIDIAAIVENMEETRKANNELRQKLLEQQQMVQENGFLNSSEKGRLLNNISDRLYEISQSEENVVLQGGEYTKTALAYLEASKSTIYGLEEDASWSEILRALPKNHRDYFIEFAKVTDEKERAEIRRKVSDYEEKVLNILWNEDPGYTESNESFFKDHYLPSTFWAGWSPRVSLDDVEIKTIQNEGMLLSDFGYYDSNANEYETQMAPVIQNYDSANSAASMRASLFSTLNGMGLFNVDVSLTPSIEPGIQMFTDITRITSYKAKEAVNNFFGARVVY